MTHPPHAQPHAWPPQQPPPFGPPPPPWPPHPRAPYPAGPAFPQAPPAAPSSGAPGFPPAPFPGADGFPPPAFPAADGFPPAGPPPPGGPGATPPVRSRRGKGAIGCAIVVLGLLVLLVVAALAVGGAERAPETGTISEAGVLSVTDLREGDCYNTRVAPPAPGTTAPISTVEAVPCTSPHTGQVIARLAYPSTDPFEGVAAKGTEQCAVQFADKLDASVLTDPAFQAGYIAPADAASWTRTPVVACIVFTEQPVTRSLLG